MSYPPVLPTATVVLGKRKERTPGNLVLRLAISPPASHGAHTESEFEAGSSSAHEESDTRRAPRAKKYECEYEGCTKAYSKPSRLAEHVRSHTGDRPFICVTCSKSYLRESHLQAHSRSHLDKSDRPLACAEPGCTKRFWTTQHLRAHSELHRGEKPFKCSEDSCDAAFLKHHHLREHICSAHAPPGTKPFHCTHPGCDKSFSMNQHLKTHMRVHGDKRYTCVDARCLVTQGTDPVFYSTWTALQHHIRTAHPPICPHPSCNGKTFTAQKGLRAHLKLHEERDIEEGLHAIDSGVDNDLDGPPLKKRRGGEVGRHWHCDVEGCTKDFKSKKALNTHQKVFHQGRRDFVCPHENCESVFGYKHLLQRHLAKSHAAASEPEASTDDDEPGAASELQLSIEDITGKTYKHRSAQQLSAAQKMQCPHPHLHDLLPDMAEALASRSRDRQCEYVFSRVYDLRRHLKAEHDIDVEKEIVTRWVHVAKSRRQ